MTADEEQKANIQSMFLSRLFFLALHVAFPPPGGEVAAQSIQQVQYNTSAANSWIQLEADDTFSGRNGEGEGGRVVGGLEEGQADKPTDY